MAVDKKARKKLAKLKRRIRTLEQTRDDLPPVNTLRSRPINVDAIWRDQVSDYAHGWYAEDDEWINRRGYL